MANFSKSAALYQLHDANFLKTALREPIRKEGSLSTSLFLKIWSGRRVSNSRPQPWQGCALPTELLPLHICPAKNLNYTRTFRSVKSKTKKIKKFWIFFTPAHLEPARPTYSPGREAHPGVSERSLARSRNEVAPYGKRRREGSDRCASKGHSCRPLKRLRFVRRFKSLKDKEPELCGAPALCSVVLETGIEPVRPNGRRILSPLRLPISSLEAGQRP